MASLTWKPRIQDYPSTVRTGNATILCSGPTPEFEAARSVLSAVTARLTHVSEALGGAITLVAAQLAFAFHTYVGVLHGVAMCRAANMDPAVFLKLMVLGYMREGPLPADLEKMVASAVARSYEEEVGATLDVWRFSLQQFIAEKPEGRSRYGPSGIYRHSCLPCNRRWSRRARLRGRIRSHCPDAMTGAILTVFGALVRPSTSRIHEVLSQVNSTRDNTNCAIFDHSEHSVATCRLQYVRCSWSREFAPRSPERRVLLPERAWRLIHVCGHTPR